MNQLMPTGRTTPVPAYIALRDNGPYGNCNRIRGVTQATTAAGPFNGAGVSGPKLGGTTTVQVLGHV